MGEFRHHHFCRGQSDNRISRRRSDASGRRDRGGSPGAATWRMASFQRNWTKTRQMSIPGARRVRCHTKHRRASGEPKCRACGKRANPCDSTWERTLTFRTHRGPRLLKRLGKGHPNTLSTSPADVESDAALRNRIEALRYRVAFPFFVSASSGSPSLLPASPSDATAGFPESS